MASTSEDTTGCNRLIAAWYPTVLVDPLLSSLFGVGDPEPSPT